MIAIVPRLAARHGAAATVASIRAAQRPTTSSLIATRPLSATHRFLATASESKSSSNTTAPAKPAASGKKSAAKKAPSKRVASSKSTARAAEQRQKQKEKEKLQKEREKLKLQMQKEKAQEKEKLQKEKEKLKLQLQKEKAQEKEKKLKQKQQADRQRKHAAQAKRAAAKEKEQKQRAVAKEKKLKAAAKEREQKQKSAAKAKAQKEKAAAKATPRNKWDLFDENGKKIPLPTANKPTRATSFMLFTSEELPKLKEDPRLSEAAATGLASILGQKWRQLSEAERQKYSEAAIKQNATYKEDLQAWLDTLSPLDQDRIKQYESAKRRQNRLARRSLTTGDDPVPKRPLNSLFRYLQDARQQAKEQGVIPSGADLSTQQAWVSEQSAAFKNLSPQQKQPYLDAYERDWAVYKRDLDAWKQRRQAS